MTWRSDSGSSRSPRLRRAGEVEKTTVTILRSSCARRLAGDQRCAAGGAETRPLRRLLTTDWDTQARPRSLCARNAVQITRHRAVRRDPDSAPSPCSAPARATMMRPPYTPTFNAPVSHAMAPQLEVSDGRRLRVEGELLLGRGVDGDGRLQTIRTSRRATPACAGAAAASCGWRTRVGQRDLGQRPPDPEPAPAAAGRPRAHRRHDARRHRAARARVRRHRFDARRDGPRAAETPEQRPYAPHELEVVAGRTWAAASRSTVSCCSGGPSRARGVCATTATSRGAMPASSSASTAGSCSRTSGRRTAPGSTACG